GAVRPQHVQVVLTEGRRVALGYLLVREAILLHPRRLQKDAVHLRGQTVVAVGLVQLAPHRGHLLAELVRRLPPLQQPLGPLSGSFASGPGHRLGPGPSCPACVPRPAPPSRRALWPLDGSRVRHGGRPAPAGTTRPRSRPGPPATAPRPPGPR